MKKKKDNTMMISVILILICYVMGIVFFVRNTIYLGIIWLVLGTGILLYGIYDNKKKNNKNIIFIILIIIFRISLIFLIIHFNHDDDFEFKTISANCNNFNISGSIAYNDNKSSIYISNINYCGGEDNTLYKKIKCALYESNGNIETKIDEYDYNDNGIKLEDFFKNVSFHIDNYKRSCKKYNKNSLYLLIDATDSDDNVTSYRVPLSLTDSCSAQP